MTPLCRRNVCILHLCTSACSEVEVFCRSAATWSASVLLLAAHIATQLIFQERKKMKQVQIYL